MKAADAWRHVYGRKYPICLTEFHFENVVGLGTGSLNFTGGITAICGPNAAGKSTLARCIRACLGTDSFSDWNKNGNRLEQSRLHARVEMQGSQVSFQWPADSSAAQIPQIGSVEFTWIEPALDSPDLLRGMCATKHLDEYVASVDPRILTAQQLEILSYLIGRQYSEVIVYELDDILGRERVPYFKVTSQGRQYGAEDMGLGEFSLFSLFWALDSLRPTSILLIEEPESFTPPRCHVHLMNFVAQVSSAKKVWTIITTHSPHILQSVPPEHIRLIVPTDASATIKVADSMPQLQALLGMKWPTQGQIFVEDYAAQLYTQKLLRHFGSDLAKIFEVCIAGSDSNVEAAVRTIPKDGSLKFVGVLDGDRRSSTAVDANSWPVVFLPGNLAPELHLIEAANASKVHFAQRLGIGIEELSVALSTVEGRNHHDWCEALSKVLALHYTNVFTALFEVWIATNDNLKAARVFLDDLCKALCL